ncbi:MAG: hypothetical protein ACI8YC_000104, partial [Salibacteraceae bacterium]
GPRLCFNFSNKSTRFVFKILDAKVKQNRR